VLEAECRINPILVTARRLPIRRHQRSMRTQLKGALRRHQLPENRQLCSLSANAGASCTTDAGLDRDHPARRLEKHVLLQEREGSEKAMIRLIRQSCLALPILTVALVALSTGCKKKVPAPVAPPAPQAEVQTPAPKPPVIHLFAAEPDTIEQGRSAELRWTVSDATELSIDQGIGAVTLRGSRRVSPAAPITYTLQAKGPGGTASAAASV